MSRENFFFPKNAYTAQRLIRSCAKADKDTWHSFGIEKIFAETGNYGIDCSISFYEMMEKYV